MKVIREAAVSLLLVSMVISAIVLSSCEKRPDTTGTPIIIGNDGWLFCETEDNGTELGDYTGKTLFTEEQLEQILTTVKAKRSFFAKNNTDLILVFIPNKMNVYSGKLPENIQAQRNSVTRISQVYEYIKKNTRVTLVDLSEIFNMNSASFDLYERTGGTLSAMGAYLAYTEIVKAVKNLNIADFNLAAVDKFEVATADDNGLEYAKMINAETYYKNKTISLTYKEALPYVSVDSPYENVTITQIPEENRIEDYKYTNLILYGNENLEKVQPFISLTFKTAIYTRGFVADGMVAKELKPSQAVVFIGEKELDKLLVNETVNAQALETAVETTPEVPVPSEPEQPASLELVPPDANTCAAPAITGKAFVDQNRLVISGVSENGTTVHAAGGDKEVSYSVYDGIFLLDIECSGNNNIEEVTLYASADGKNNSEEVNVRVSGMDRNYKSVVVGKDGHIHIDATAQDFLGSNIYNSGVLTTKRRNMEKLLSKIREVSPHTKLIYLISPNHSTIYPETMPDWLQAQRHEKATSKLNQLAEKMKDSEVIFLNISDYLISKKTEDLLLYQKTDTHWNELGAYYAYEYLMNDIISKDFPEAKAVPLSEFDVFIKNVPGGDMLNFLGMNLDLARENAVYVRPKFTPVLDYDKPYRMNFENIWTSDLHIVENDKEGLPTMMMYRDSFSTNLMMFLSESFSFAYFNNMWNYNVDTKLVEEIQPDYIIMEYVERSIDGVGQ